MENWNPFVELLSFVKKCVEYGPSILRVAPSGLLRSFDGWNFYDEAVIVIIGSGGSGIVLAFLSPST